jgi:hypothetical protein
VRSWYGFTKTCFLMMDGLAFSSIDDDDSNNLNRLFTEEEVCVRGCVKDMVGDKAPGPDGFSMAFFQSC